MFNTTSREPFPDLASPTSWSDTEPAARPSVAARRAPLVPPRPLGLTLRRAKSCALGRPELEPRISSRVRLPLNDKFLNDKFLNENWRLMTDVRRSMFNTKLRLRNTGRHPFQKW